jgi:type I restriction enzyme M protein
MPGSSTSRCARVSEIRGTKIGDGTNGRPEQIGEITKIYSNFYHDETPELSFDGHLKKRSVSKIFVNDDFRFYKITVERPLRLKFSFSEQSLGKMEDEPAFQKLATSSKHQEDQRISEIEAGRKRQEEIREFLRNLIKEHEVDILRDREEFIELLKEEERRYGFRLEALERKAIVNSCG